MSARVERLGPWRRYLRSSREALRLVKNSSAVWQQLLCIVTMDFEGVRKDKRCAVLEQRAASTMLEVAPKRARCARVQPHRMLRRSGRSRQVRPVSGSQRWLLGGTGGRVGDARLVPAIGVWRAGRSLDGRSAAQQVDARENKASHCRNRKNRKRAGGSRKYGRLATYTGAVPHSRHRRPGR